MKEEDENLNLVELIQSLLDEVFEKSSNDDKENPENFEEE